MHPDWVRAIRDQCATAGVAFFMKQWGEFGPLENFAAGGIAAVEGDDDQPHVYRVGKKAAGRLLDGRTHDEFPRVAA